MGDIIKLNRVQSAVKQRIEKFGFIVEVAKSRHGGALFTVRHQQGHLVYPPCGTQELCGIGAGLDLGYVLGRASGGELSLPVEIGAHAESK
jgi:hypothetical protein